MNGTGSKIIFSGLDDKERIKSITGITGVWAEEATEFTKEEILQLNLRLRTKVKTYLQLILTFNPVSPHHWIKKHFFDKERESCTIIHSTYKDNKHLPADYIQELEHLADDDSQYYKIYALGEWGELQGVIFNNWTAIEDSEFPDNYDDRFLGIDFGFNDPSVVLEIRIKDQAVYVHQHIYESGLTNTDLITKMDEVSHLKEMQGFADSAEPARIEEMRRRGYNIIGANKEVNRGIDYVKTCKLFITKSSQETIKDFSMYKWKEDRDGKSIDTPAHNFSHAPDAVRYGLYTNHKRGSAEPIASTGSYTFKERFRGFKGELKKYTI